MSLDGYKVAVFNDSRQNEVYIFCQDTSSSCQPLDEGTYPARWIENEKKMEILGWNEDKRKWVKTEYSVAVGQP
jgi:hypothetical protein